MCQAKGGERDRGADSGQVLIRVTGGYHGNPAQDRETATAQEEGPSGLSSQLCWAASGLVAFRRARGLSVREAGARHSGTELNVLTSVTSAATCRFCQNFDWRPTFLWPTCGCQNYSPALAERGILNLSLATPQVLCGGPTLTPNYRWKRQNWGEARHDDEGDHRAPFRQHASEHRCPGVHSCKRAAEPLRFLAPAHPQRRWPPDHTPQTSNLPVILGALG
ncbi:hypothetical protein SKAU_G00101280 [Synaphobranchus kaupii]|uniref:Uncharacterized protein n=1 Tax=Synaphobranchus kaupii TaxID=118154 RepID=A0A9Q1FYK6_SYNKA|nr:hypothetical protein SKAU_G00101280 [Synaphobranchus kaupii]